MSKFCPLKIVQQTNRINTATVVFLHGSGDTGSGILEWIKLLIDYITFPHIKLVFPTAPFRPYTPLKGEKSNVWFDRADIAIDVPEHNETIDSTGDEIKKIIDQEISTGVPLNRIVVGGFSMGGALALHLAYRIKPGFAGVFALSSFLNRQSVVYESLRTKKSGVETPLFMCHGDRDPLVPIHWGRETYENLSTFGVKGDFIPLSNTVHEMKKAELLELFRWITKLLPEKA